MGVQLNEWLSDHNNYTDMNKGLFPDAPIYIAIPVGSYYLSSVSLHLIAAIDACIFILGLVGNTIACIVIACSKSMHTPTNYYLFSLSMSDILLLVTGAPHEIHEIYNPDSFYGGPVVCSLRSWAAEVSVNVSAITITAFTFERYLAICRPFFAHTMSQVSRVKKLIVIIWIVAALISLPVGVVQIRYENRGNMISCEFDETIIPFSLEVTTTLFFIIPLIVISVMYVLMGMNLMKAARMDGTDLNEAQVHVRVDNSNKRIIKMLVVIVLAFFLCWAPFHVQRLMTEHFNDITYDENITGSYEKVYCIVTHVSGIMYLLSTVVNPLIYSIMSSKFREAFQELLLRTAKSVNHTCYYGWRKKLNVPDPANISATNETESTCIQC